MIFTSDNAAGVVPEVLEALGQAAAGTAPAYGTDPWSEAVEARVRTLFEAPEACVYLVTTGTAANALALGCLCPPWSAIYAHQLAHIERDECGAPEFFTGGAKLTLIEGEQARMAPDGLRQRIRIGRSGGVHQVGNGALSITQATEFGTAYSLAEITALTAIAREAGIGVHMDGTRFANALARSNASPADMSWRAGVDILCLGATKCGAMAAEAVVLFDPALAEPFELRRKRGGHLLSKMRYVAAQMEAWLADGLWLRLASRANGLADRMAAGLQAHGIPVLNELGANIVFAEFTYGLHARLEAAGAQYYIEPPWQPETGPAEAPVSVRLVCSFATAEAEIDEFLELIGHG
ncbi:MAG: beta-eliminating lyase-related protein [Pseudomonadota bacterium]